MSNDDPDEAEKDNGKIRSRELAAEADETEEGEMPFTVSDECPPEVAAQFRQNVAANAMRRRELERFTGGLKKYLPYCPVRYSF